MASSTTRWPRLFAAGATSGLLVGFGCGIYLAARNPIGGPSAKLLFVFLTALGYAALLALPITLALAAGSAVASLLPDRLRTWFGDFGGLVGVGLAAAGLAVTARRLTGVWLADLGLKASFAGSLRALAILLGFAVTSGLIRLAWNVAEKRFGALHAAGLGSLGLCAAGLVAVPLASPTKRGAAAVARAATTDQITAGTPGRRVALIGFDGLDPSILEPLMASGDMPRFKRLADHGLSSELDTLALGLSPPIWATIATGADPARHGIHDFVTRPLRFAGLDLAAIKTMPRGSGFATLVSVLQRAGLAGEGLVTPLDRRAPAIWTLSSLAGLETAVVDWMTTWPSEPITGAMVSDRAFFLANLERSGELPATSEEHSRGALPIRFRFHQTESETSGLCSPEPDCLSWLPPAAGERLDPARQVADFHLAEDAFYLAAAERLLADSDYRLLMYYSHLPDFLNHQLSVEELEQVRGGRYLTPTASLTREVYRQVDRTLGTLLDHLDGFSDLIVSDHGVEIVERGRHRAVSHAAGPPGVFFFRPSEERPLDDLEIRPSIYDVAPTVLALLGLPLTTQMPGLVLDQVVEAELGPGASFQVVDAGDALAASAAAQATMSPEAEEEIRERLRSLGYLK